MKAALMIERYAAIAMFVSCCVAGIASASDESSQSGDWLAAAQDSALMRALGLAYHWQRLLDEDRSTSVAAIAKAEGMDVTQVRRIMRLTLLAPEVIERLVGAPDIVLEQVMRRPWPSSWVEQMQVMAHAARD